MLGEATRLIAMVSVGREHLIVLTVSKGRWPVIRLKWVAQKYRESRQIAKTRNV